MKLKSLFPTFLENQRHDKAFFSPSQESDIEIENSEHVVGIPDDLHQRIDDKQVTDNRFFLEQ